MSCGKQKECGRMNETKGKLNKQKSLAASEGDAEKAGTLRKAAQEGAGRRRG